MLFPHVDVTEQVAEPTTNLVDPLENIPFSQFGGIQNPAEVSPETDSPKQPNAASASQIASAEQAGESAGHAQPNVTAIAQAGVITTTMSSTATSQTTILPITPSRNSTISGSAIDSATETTFSGNTATTTYPEATLGNANAQQTPTTLSTSSADSGLSTGAIAGIAVGSAAGAAIIAFLITFFCMRGRNRKQLQAGPRKLQSDLDEKSSGALLLPPYVQDTMGLAIQPSWMNHLPAPESEIKIGEQVSVILDRILRHVDKYYQDINVELSPEITGKLETVDSNHLPESVVDMLPRTMHPTALIKHCIANEIISRISSTGGNAETFLPEDHVNLPKAISSANGNWRHPVAFDPAFSQWRVLTSYLRPPPISDPLHQDSVEATIKEAGAKLSGTFSPWAINDYSVQERQEDLMSVMKEAAEVGIMIFAQPSTFIFRWMDSSMLGSAVEVTPSFVKAMDEDGRRLERQPLLVQGRAEAV